MIQQCHFWEYTQRKEKSVYWRDICTLMFIAPLVTIAKMWKQPMPMDSWLKKMYKHTHTEEYYWAMRKKKILPICDNTD